jgi:hypothetical protein
MVLAVGLVSTGSQYFVCILYVGAWDVELEWLLQKNGTEGGRRDQEGRVTRRPQKDVDMTRGDAATSHYY